MRSRWLAAVLLSCTLLLPWTTCAETSPPPYLGRAAGVTLMPQPFYEEFAEVAMPVGPERSVARRGRHWTVEANLPGVPLEAPAAQVWNRLHGLFPAPGWSVVHHAATNVTLRYAGGGKEAWAQLNYGDPSDIRIEVIEIAGQTRQITLQPPSAKPETLRPTEDIPYLAPLPGSKLVSGGFNAVPLRARLHEGEEETLLAEGVHERLYAGPPENISPLQVSEIYGPALQQAGWTIVNRWLGGYLAHFTRNGRDLWAVIGSGSGDLHFRVADAGAVDLAARLRKECRAPLDGVLFDFDKASLKAESTPALERVRAAVVALADLRFEVQGHTDNVGADDHNLKLSQARALTVRDWLTARGVAAARLTNAGYGRSRPVADNATPDGRARNRRVELACLR